MECMQEVHDESYRSLLGFLMDLFIALEENEEKGTKIDHMKYCTGHFSWI